MGLQKYRAQRSEGPDTNGAIRWYADWMGGPTLSLIRNCPTPFGPRTVYIRDEPDTFFSIPAACRFRGVTMTGYVTWEDNQVIFHAHNKCLFSPIPVKEEAEAA